MSWSPTHSTSRPGLTSWLPSGQTQPSGRPSPEASLSRRSMTSAAVTPGGRSTSARQPGPSRVIGDGNETAPGFLASAWVIPDKPSTLRARTTSSLVSREARGVTTAVSSSGRSAGAPSTPSSATSPASSPQRTQEPTGASSTTGSTTSSTAVAVAVTVDLSRTRALRCWDSLRYCSVSSRRRAAWRAGAPSASRVHRRVSASRRAAPRGARTTSRVAYLGLRVAW
jgi:hypothetical protein